MFKIPNFIKLSQRNLSSVIDFEIEKKFLCDHNVIDYCSKHAKSIQRKHIIDIYYDNPSYDLTTRDMWLRQRNGRLELKWPQVLKHDTKMNGIDFYFETTDEDIIKSTIGSILHPSPSQTLALSTWLTGEKIQPFGTIDTYRIRHMLDIDISKVIATPPSDVSVYVDIDFVSYHQHALPDIMSHDHDDKTDINELFSQYSNQKDCYIIGEIELAKGFDTTESKHMKRADSLIREVFSVIGIKSHDSVRGKVLEYLYRYLPQHYQALKSSGQLASKGILEK